MASAKCAREECGKTVYPIEELKCLDKIWHKGCFKCTECGMTLSMKTYKGYEKKPYCQAHYPKTVPSAVMETPEMNRVKTNTAIQSQVKYHEQYEKQMKGTKIEVVDDPESQRHKINAQNQSLAHYHGEQKKKEQQDSHRGDAGGGELPAAYLPYAYARSGYTSPLLDSSGHASSLHNNGNHHQLHAIGELFHHQQQQSDSHCQFGDKDYSPYSQRIAQQAHGTVIYSSEMGGRVVPNEKPVGSIADYDPMATENKATAGQQQVRRTSAGGPKTAGNGFAVKALYDYTAADKDEVSFKEGDIIVNCQKVDDGWMTGTVQRTLLWGMLPANYVEKVNQPVGQFKLK